MPHKGLFFSISIMKIKHLILALLTTWAFNGATFAQAAEKQEIKLEEIWLQYKFIPGFPQEFNWMKDDNYYSVLEKDKIVRFSSKDKKPAGEILDIGSLKDPDTGESIKVSTYSFSKDESKILLKTEVEPIYRRSTKEKCYVWDTKASKLYKLHDGELISFPHFSPDASKIGYTHENDLYYKDFASGKRVRVTEDGKWGEIINGGTDWVYEEEFAFARAFTWSEDSRKIAYYRFDETAVREFSMDMYGSLYPEPYKFKYPKAGEDNADVQIFVYHVDGGRRAQVDIGPEKDQYIPRIKWTKDPDKLAVMRMNRLQNKCEVLIAEAGTGSSKVILTETEDQYVDEATDSKWMFLDNGTEFIWQSEADGQNHLYLYGMDGKLVRQITKGDWSVTEIAAIDEGEGMIYYMSTEASPIERHLYSITLEGKKKKQLTKAPGWHSVSFSSNNSFYMDSYSSADSPGESGLYDQKGKELENLEDNKRLKKIMDNYELTNVEFFKFKTEANVELEGWMIKPPAFDATKEYPVLMYVYGGPGSQTVKNQFGSFNYFWHQMLAQQGYIVVSVDGRGTGGRGESFKKVTYGQMGKYEAEDQIAAAKYLAGLDYVDGDRIGIWGWSFGGYMSSLVLTKGNGTFKMGIAVAPVTSWRYYDSIYTERYLKTPQLNPSGYDENSPIEFAGDLQGSYLLVHGTADDNVHFQNSMEWVDALVNANKPFDMAFYPNKNHGIFGGPTRYHLYKKMTDFIMQNL